ncbi:MAG: hypothetical protein R3Y56_02305 [Akkermansia sp.]
MTKIPLLYGHNYDVRCPEPCKIYLPNGELFVHVRLSSTCTDYYFAAFTAQSSYILCDNAAIVVSPQHHH